MGVASCAINGLYSMICRDPEYGNGGLDPSEKQLHADGFFKEDRIPLEELAPSGIDRRVQIMYKGTDEWGKLTNGLGAKKQRVFSVSVDVGYFVGDHQIRSELIIADDEELIGKRCYQQAYWPNCTSGCVQGYVPVNSSLVELGDGRMINQITVQVTVYG